MKISLKIAIAIVSSLLFLFAALIFEKISVDNKTIKFTEQQVTNSIAQEKQAGIMQQLDSVKTIAESIAKIYIESEEPIEETKQDILTYISSARYGINKNGTFIVLDTKGTTIINPDHPELIGKNTLVNTDDNGVKYNQEIFNNIENRNFYVKITIDGQEYMQSGMKISIADTQWIIMARAPTVVTKQNIEKFLNLLEENSNSSAKTFISIAIVIIIISIITALIYARISIIKPLNNLINRANNLSSGDGDLTVKLDDSGKDEIAMASKAINAFIEKVRKLINDAKNLSSENSSIANELSSSSLQTGKRVGDSTAIVSKVSSSCSDINSNMKDSIEEAKTGKKNLQEAIVYIDEVNKAMLNLNSKISTSAQTENEMSDKINQLAKEADQVKEVLDVINEIADQTNLLALNAAIEAARAGEHGRGFAVVADEVRNLAEKTQSSLVEINATINIIVQSINDSSKQMNINAKDINDLTNVAQEVEKSIKNMSEVIGGAIKLSDTTVDDYIDTGKNIDTIVKDIEEINLISKENARSVEEIAGAAEHLNKMTDQLNAKLGEFRT
ncbi:methyl-accepting chemotaxis protein [Campylobacter sputorum]|uniref:methyl-accepting chemotaxis protein n=1 Tax=Campylobacter sputorum TaxID=206 RepID=UPI00053C007C|nr:methyl-accepting chemotaxis protein [Campylobacter sputorum]